MFVVAVLPISGNMSQHAHIHGACVRAEVRDHAPGVNDTNVVGEVPIDDIHCGSGALIPVTSGTILHTPRSLTSDGHQIVIGDVYILTFLSIFLLILLFYLFIFFWVILYYHLIFICAVVLGDKLQLVNGNITYNTDVMKDEHLVTDHIKLMVMGENNLLEVFLNFYKKWFSLNFCYIKTMYCICIWPYANYVLFIVILYILFIYFLCIVVVDDDEISYDGNLLSSSHPVGMYVSNNIKCEMLTLY